MQHGVRVLACSLLGAIAVFSQTEIQPATPGGKVLLYPSDLAVLETSEPRQDLPCVVRPIEPVLGFDLRFHTGYRFRIPLKDLAGAGGTGHVIVRVIPRGADEPVYLSDHFAIPPGVEGARGEVVREAGFQLGEGRYRVDWLLRDTGGRVCSAHWEVTAKNHRDAPAAALPANTVRAEAADLFEEEPPVNRNGAPISVKVLLNVSAPPGTRSAERVAVLVSMLRVIGRDPRISRLSLVAFDVPSRRVLFRQGSSSRIDFPGLGSALRERPSMLVDYRQLQQKDGDSLFFRSMLEREIGDSERPDAIVFLGPGLAFSRRMEKLGADPACPIFFVEVNAGMEAEPSPGFAKSIGGRVYRVYRPVDWAAAWQGIMAALTTRP